MTYFLSTYPVGHFGLVPVIFLVNFPFTQVIVSCTGGKVVVVVDVVVGRATLGEA